MMLHHMLKITQVKNPIFDPKKKERKREINFFSLSSCSLNFFSNKQTGGDAILRRAGLDNTKGFYGSQHPSFVHHEIKRYAIGTIAD